MEQEGHTTSVVCLSETVERPWLEDVNVAYSRSGFNGVGERTYIISACKSNDYSP